VKTGRTLASVSIVVLAIGPWATRSAAQVRGDDLPVHEVRLENGLRLLVLPRPGAPTVSFVVQYAVGGIDEHLGTTGIAHVLEHMLFKGTTTIGTRDHDAELPLFRRMDAAQDTILALRGGRSPDTLRLTALRERIRMLEDSARTFVVPNEFSLILSRNGGRGLNASTTNEATTYYVELPSNRLELWFAMEADRMTSPVFREFYTERDVVMEERRTRIDTNPDGILQEQHLATAFTMHPYGVPVAGYMSDLENLTRPRVEEYFRRYYGPNNAVVAIVGDVDPERVETLARTYLEGIPQREEPPPVLAVEPPQRGERRIEVEFDAQSRLRMGWHTVDAFHPDMPALVMLASVLTGGRNSRLYRRLVVEDRIATQVLASMGPGDRHPQLFQISAIPLAASSAAEVEAAIQEEIDRLRESPPGDDELERVRTRIEAGNVHRLESNLGLAFQLAGSAALYGDWRTTFRLSNRIRDVTPADVLRVVDRYFLRSNLTVAVLERRDGAGSEP
jgi:predicted Zn-dependent peptidase